jgi:phosphatidylglycerol:prolipoprotein diacylglycerol transferase
LPVRAYGLLLALSFVVGVLYIKRVVERDKKPFEPYLTIATLMILGGVIGARLFYVLFHLEEFAGNWAATINPFHEGQFGIAGLNLYGGVLMALAATIWYCRRAKLSVLETFDYFSPTLGIGLAITRIGCFLNGCCFGLPTSMPWGIEFPDGSIPDYVFHGQRLHPTQIYSSLYGLLLFLFLNWLLPRKKFTGQLVAFLFMAEATFRFFIEDLRYYENEMKFTLDGSTVTYNQIISVALFVAGLIIFAVQRRRAAIRTEPVASK